jgi:peroxiredoxin
MKLTKGQKAIDFTVKDIYGNKILLSSFIGKKVLLSFFRNVNCPFCNLRVHELSKKRDEFERNGLKMIFFFESTNNQLRRSIFHKEISPIPLVGDPEKKVYNQYGIEASTLKMMSTFLKGGTMEAMKKGNQYAVPEEKENHVTLNLIPADFLIDENLIIQKAHYGSHVRDHLPIEDIRAFVGIQ